MPLRNFVLSITKYAIIIFLIYYAAKSFFDYALVKFDQTIEENFSGLNLRKLQNEIIKAAKDGGIDPKDQELLGKSIGIIYSRDIEPILDHINTNPKK